jgi:hypothetical protein
MEEVFSIWNHLQIQQVTGGVEKHWDDLVGQEFPAV